LIWFAYPLTSKSGFFVSPFPIFLHRLQWMYS
jgi:hypothetical protein